MQKRVDLNCTERGMRKKTCKKKHFLETRKNMFKISLFLIRSFKRYDDHRQFYMFCMNESFSATESRSENLV
jgi:hypothetical protein